MNNVIDAIKTTQLRRLETNEPVRFLDGRQVLDASVINHGHAAYSRANLIYQGAICSIDRRYIYPHDEKERLVEDLEKLIAGAQNYIELLTDEMEASAV